MRNALISILFFIASISYGQLGGSIAVSSPPNVSLPTTFSDDFEQWSSPSALGGNGYWVNIEGALEVLNISDNRVNPNSTGARSACYYNIAIDGDQYSQVVMDQAGSVAAGCIVRASTGAATYYYWYGTTTVSYLRRRVAGSDTDLDVTGTGFSTTDVIKLEAEGDTLFCYINGVLDTNIDGDGKYVDDGVSKLSSGYVGIIGYGNTSSVDMDDFEGGELDR